MKNAASVRRSNVEKLLKMKYPYIEDERFTDIPEPGQTLEEFLRGRKDEAKNTR